MTLLRTIFNRTVKPPFVAGRDALTGFLERRSGIHTAGIITLEELGLAAEDRVEYKPSEWFTLARILPLHEVDKEDVFIDFGSGLGRVVFQAAMRYPFKRVIGVEISKELNDVAKTNIVRNQDRLRCKDVQLIVSDVLDYEIPDDVTIAFFYNPFVGDVFRAVVENLIASLDRHPRRLRIIYRNPVEHEYLISTGRFRPTRRLRGFRPEREWARSNSTQMYEAHPR